MKDDLASPELVVEHDIPLPSIRRRAKTIKYPWHNMKRIGDSFLVPVIDAAEMQRIGHAVRAAARYQGNRTGRKYVVRETRGGGMRVWLWQYAPEELAGERTISAGLCGDIIFKASDLCQICALPRDGR